MVGQAQNDEEIQKKIQLIKDNCIFCKIGRKEIESKIIFEDEVCLIILDIAPKTTGHSILVLKEHYMIMQMVPEKILGHINSIALMIETLLKKTFKPENVKIVIANGIAAEGHTQHFLMHIIPEYKDEKFNLNIEGEEIFPSELENLQNEFKNELLKMNKNLERAV